MMTEETNRKLLYKQQTDLRTLMSKAKHHDEAMALFFRQHAQLHAADVSQTGLWSFADEVLNSLTDEQIRAIPKNNTHSIAWCLWHIARIEDATMNLLVAGEAQVFTEGGWNERINAVVQNTGNGMTDEDISALSARIDVDALKAYRIAVGRKTREIVETLQAEDLKAKVKPERIHRLLSEGVLADTGKDLAEYWGNRTIAGLLLMPATRHNLSHLNESQELKKRVNK